MSQYNAQLEPIFPKSFFWWTIAILTFFLGKYVALGSAGFSEQQSYYEAREAYERCERAAPEGFDCAMVPMLVSKEYLEHNFK